MAIDLNAKDRLGVPMSRSWQPEFDLLARLEALGLSVDEAVKLRKTKELPQAVLDDWDKYDALNKARFPIDC
jgi:hypothetical protein